MPIKIPLSELKHVGRPHDSGPHSGRYEWGSGENPYQRSLGWKGHVALLKKKGLTEKQMAEGEGIKIREFRARGTISTYEIRAAERAEAIRLKEHGYSNMEIGRRMGRNESSIRNLLDPVLAERAEIAMITANMLKEEIAKNRFIDIGAGVAPHLGISDTKLNASVAILQEEGYKIHNVKVPQAGIPGQFTRMKAIGPPDSEWKEIVTNDSFDKIKNISMISDDYGRTFRSNRGLEPIESVSSDRIEIRYSEDGGRLKDGVIELRRGVKDLDMGGSQYAQVRIGVDDTHYLKGMALYTDDLPDGVDIRFNTNKHPTGNKLDAMKKMNRTDDGIIDQDNPFGATIKEGGQRGALNIVNEEGDWSTWSKTLSSQMLSKQSVPLVKKQLDLSYKQKQEEFDEISAYTNEVIKKQLLLSFADDCDSSSVHLKAAGLPRQASKVILPVPELKENEVYAPGFRQGEPVVLIRHPHGGKFEIPQVIVNNNSKAAKSVMENAADAIGINPKVAQKLSGADFDGDTVIVIPNKSGLVRTAASLKVLEHFDPQEYYPPFDGMKTIDGGRWDASARAVDYGGKKPRTQNKQQKMGTVSNLITDMTIKGADLDEIARAVKHSMVVIDSEKHSLNYAQSFKDNNIAELHAKYQNGPQGGASTIVSRAKAQTRVDDYKPRPAKEGGPIDPETGRKVYVLTGESYTTKAGKTVVKQKVSRQMVETDDAFELSSGRPVEDVYAGYANNLKALANRSRRDALASIPTPYSPSAKKVYESEVRSLVNKLRDAEKNKPLERQAQAITASVVKRIEASYGGLDADDLKKVRNQALAEARVRTGADKHMINIEPREWEAIQSGAVSPSRLTQIVQNTKLEDIKRLATPRTSSTMTATKVSRAKSMLASGLTLAEVADSLGVSVSTISNSIK